MKIFFSVGEPSGDLHGANLIRQLRHSRADMQCVGYGGPRMAEAGCHLHEELTRLAVMGVWCVLMKIHTFWDLLRRADRYFSQSRPDAVVLIDYPGFNWWIARKAKKHGIPVFYYGVPQLWAWASWRVGKMRRLVDHALCKLPFEPAWYAAHGCKATYVGHPYFDQMEQQTLDGEFVDHFQRRQGLLVTILPGSRTQEVVNNLHWFLKSAQIIAEKVPDVRFAVASFNESQAEMARQQIAQTRLSAEVFVGRTAELIHLADCCLACSGSVSLELLYHAKPTVILYCINRYWFFIQSCLRKVKYITLVNLLATDDVFSGDLSLYDPTAAGADRVPFPEYLTCQDKTQQIADHVIQWLSDPAKRHVRVAELVALRQRFGRGGASKTAAEYVLGRLDERAAKQPPAQHAA